MTPLDNGSSSPLRGDDIVPVEFTLNEIALIELAVGDALDWYREAPHRPAARDGMACARRILAKTKPITEAVDA